MKLSKLYKVVLASSMMVASAAVFAAQPNAKVYSSSINIEGLYNADVQKNIDSQISKLTSKKYTLVLKDLTEEEIKAAVDKYPEVTGVTVDSDKIRSIAALAGMKNLESVYVNSKYVSDYTPLADKVTLTSLRIDSEDIDNLKWMTKLERLSTVDITGSIKLQDLTGLPKLPALRKISLNHIQPSDLSVLAAQVPGVSQVDLRYAVVKDLAPLCALGMLNNVDLYGATVTDYGQLENCSKLTKVTTYASKTADFSALKKIKSLEEINGGLTDLSDVSWVTELPNLKKFDVFAEKVHDFAPIAKSTIEDFKVWSMKDDIDLSSLANAKNIKKFTIWGGQKKIDNVEKALETMENLEKLELTSMDKGTPNLDGSFAKNLKKLSEVRIEKLVTFKTEGMENLSALSKISIGKVTNPVNVAFMEKLEKLESVELHDVTVENSQALANNPHIKYVNLKNIKGFDLEALKKNANLQRVTLSSKDFTKEQIQGFASTVKVSYN